MVVDYNKVVWHENLVLGASGMLGNAVLRVMDERHGWEVFGAVRSGNISRFFSNRIAARLIVGCEVGDHDALAKLFAQVRPDVVINRLHRRM